MRKLVLAVAATMLVASVGMYVRAGRPRAHCLGAFYRTNWVIDEGDGGPIGYREFGTPWQRGMPDPNRAYVMLGPLGSVRLRDALPWSIAASAAMLASLLSFRRPGEQ
jgi:hypothetical protein